jgi:hypothetical protein
MKHTKEAIKALNNEWSENWDQVIDFFGQELADKFDKAIIEPDTTQEREKEISLIVAVIIREDILNGSVFQTFDKAHEIATEFIKIHPASKTWEDEDLDFDETIIVFTKNTIKNH